MTITSIVGHTTKSTLSSESTYWWWVCMGIALPLPIPNESDVYHVSKWSEPQRLDKHLIEKTTADTGIEIVYDIIKTSGRRVVTTGELINSLENSNELKTTDGMAPSHSTMRRWINTARDRLRLERMAA